MELHTIYWIDLKLSTKFCVLLSWATLLWARFKSLASPLPPSRPEINVESRWFAPPSKGSLMAPTREGSPPPSSLFAKVRHSDRVSMIRFPRIKPQCPQIKSPAAKSSTIEGTCSRQSLHCKRKFRSCFRLSFPSIKNKKVTFCRAKSRTRASVAQHRHPLCKDPYPHCFDWTSDPNLCSIRHIKTSSLLYPGIYSHLFYYVQTELSTV